MTLVQIFYFIKKIIAYRFIPKTPADLILIKINQGIEMIRKKKKALVNQKNLKKFSLLTNENINRGINVNKIMIGPLIKIPTAREVQKR